MSIAVQTTIPTTTPYPQSVEPDIVASMGGITYGPYTGTWFDSTSETDIEHIVARSEAHDSGLCAADAATKRRFASDLLNLTLASPAVNRSQKGGKDAAEWLPDLNQSDSERASLDEGLRVAKAMLADVAATARFGVTDSALDAYRARYGEWVTKDHIFSYVYGILHSPDYRKGYADDLARLLPRIPEVATAEAFRAFSEAGQRLLDLHIGYETAEPYPLGRAHQASESSAQVGWLTGTPRHRASKGTRLASPLMPRVRPYTRARPWDTGVGADWRCMSCR